MCLGAPLVTIIIPTYNRWPLLDQAIESVRAQTLPDWEMCVVDDGSTDGTEAAVRRIPDDRIHLMRSPHTGSPARARNLGLSRARGRYVAFLDSDDLWLPGKLEVQVAALRGRPECHWAYTLFGHIDDAGREMNALRPVPGMARSGWILEDVLEHQALVIIPTLLAETPLLRGLRGLDETPGVREDYDLCLRLAEHSPAAAVDQRLVLVRHHAGRSTFGVPEVRRWTARTYASCEARSSDNRIRALCRRQRAVVLTELAALYRSAGRTREALKTLVSAFWLSPWSGRWWGNLIKTLVRPLTPAPLLRMYRSSRHGAAVAQSRGRRA